MAATECYVKISFPPYLLELDIDGCIDSAQHKARVEKGILVVKLKKKSDNFGIWGSLGQRVDRKCDPKVTARREQSIKEKLKWEEEVSRDSRLIVVLPWCPSLLIAFSTPRSRIKYVWKMGI